MTPEQIQERIANIARHLLSAIDELHELTINLKGVADRSATPSDTPICGDPYPGGGGLCLKDKGHEATGAPGDDLHADQGPDGPRYW